MVAPSLLGVPWREMSEGRTSPACRSDYHRSTANESCGYGATHTAKDEATVNGLGRERFAMSRREVVASIGYVMAECSKVYD